jgi:hypothetical protein
MMPPGEVGRSDWKLIHPSAWKGYSPKFRFRIVNILPHRAVSLRKLLPIYREEYEE